MDRETALQWVWRLRGLTASERTVILYMIYRGAWQRDGAISRGEIADPCELSLRSAQRVVDDLAARGLLAIGPDDRACGRGKVTWITPAQVSWQEVGINIAHWPERQPPKPATWLVRLDAITPAQQRRLLPAKQPLPAPTQNPRREWVEPPRNEPAHQKMPPQHNLPARLSYLVLQLRKRCYPLADHSGYNIYTGKRLAVCKRIIEQQAGGSLDEAAMRAFTLAKWAQRDARRERPFYKMTVEMLERVFDELVAGPDSPAGAASRHTLQRDEEAAAYSAKLAAEAKAQQQEQ